MGEPRKQWIFSDLIHKSCTLSFVPHASLPPSRKERQADTGGRDRCPQGRFWTRQPSLSAKNQWTEVMKAKPNGDLNQAIKMYRLSLPVYQCLFLLPWLAL